MRTRRTRAAIILALLALACGSPPEQEPTKPATTPGPGFVVIGHRGNPVVAPENTLRSIESAFAVGADVVEVDVRLTRDGVPVLFHDDTLERTTLGSGPVEDASLEELRPLRAMSRFDETAGEPIPTLEEALLAARGRGRLLLDINADGMAPTIAALLDRLEVPQGILEVAAWSEAQADEYLAHLPGAAVIAVGLPDRWRDGALGLARERGLAGFDVGGDVPAEFVAAAHEAGLRVYVYTINDGDRMRRLIERGVDGIETDVPELLAAVVQQMRGQGFGPPTP